MDIKRILVPIDFSAGSLKALASACDLGQRFGAELVLLHVVEPIYVPDPYVAASPEVLETRWNAAKMEMARLRADLERQGRRVRTLVRDGAPSQIIVDTARSTDTDLIVMGTHGRTGLAHMWIGSVAEKVVRTAGCPVLTVRGADTSLQ
jgi:universal stress protein A